MNVEVVTQCLISSSYREWTSVTTAAIALPGDLAQAVHNDSDRLERITCKAHAVGLCSFLFMTHTWYPDPPSILIMGWFTPSSDGL